MGGLGKTEGVPSPFEGTRLLDPTDSKCLTDSLSSASCTFVTSLCLPCLEVLVSVAVNDPA